MHVRRARWRDVPAMVELAGQRRLLLEQFAPRFWRRAPDAPRRTSRYLRFLLLTGRATLFVAEEHGRLVGMLNARRVAAPPVYDPGGASLLIDDFFVTDPQLWPSAGAMLLDAAARRGRELGAVQLIVVAPVQDQAQSDWLAAHDLAPVSSWWVKGL